jgi:hypothetical protein
MTGGGLRNPPLHSITITGKDINRGIAVKQGKNTKFTEKRKTSFLIIFQYTLPAQLQILIAVAQVVYTLISLVPTPIQY